ncbi:MAG: hypothetical protein FRX49_02697 [Trebouxia sp. A1-2]|nr:MAG: hypothetical protein FRX49_02697 [Trebouxia sp. A1-2]
MASKRSTRTIRPADQEQAIGVHDRRDDAATKRRLLLTAAAVVVVLTGAFAAFRVGGQISGRALQGMHSFPSIPLDSEQRLNSHAEASDTDPFPSSSSLTSAADRQANSAPANKAKSLSQNSKQGDAAHLTQQPHDPSSHALPGTAASEASNLTDAAASAASSAADSSANWASAFKDQLTAASDKITSGFQSATGSTSSTLSVASGKVASGLQLAASNVTATLASKASGIASKAKTTAQGQSTQEIHSTAKEQLTAKQQSKSKWQNTVKSPASRKGSAGPVAFPWDFKMAKQTRDGRCDDGSTGEEDQVFCDLGTDCSDCGPWTFSVPSQQANQTLPIKLLHSRQIDVFVKNTSTVPSFQMAYTDPMKDVDVSGQMEHGGVVEMGLTMMWYKALKDKCIQRDGSRALVVDVGGNFGWYSIYAATLGCRVITWEPVPHFRAFLEYNRQLNHLEDLIDIRDTAVAEVSGVTYDLTVPQRGIWGTAGIGGLNIDGSVDNQGDYEMVTAMGERVDEVVAENVVLLKADVEGLEPGVIQSAKGLLESYKVDHVVMEYSPGAWEIHDKWDEYIDLANMLAYLLDLGYTLLHVHDGLARAPLLQLPEWSGGMGEFEEVTADHLQHDMADAKLLQLQLMGCPKPKELKQVGKVWGGCNAIPEDLHPKSFRAAFGHNTNVGTPVGVMALDQDLNEWYGQQPLKLGMGYRPCDLISPDVQVRHRCTCTNVTVCGAEAKLIETLAKQGRMPPFPSQDSQSMTLSAD